MTPSLFYREISLTRSQVAIVDPEDYDALIAFKWQAHLSSSTKAFYASRTAYLADGKKVYVSMHREILGLNDPSVCGDHINGNTLDNRRCNLRIATKHQNNLNTKVRSDNASGYKGVTRRGDRWIAQMNLNGKRLHLGMGDTPEEAYALYCDAARKHHGEFARLASKAVVPQEERVNA